MNIKIIWISILIFAFQNTSSASDPYWTINLNGKLVYSSIEDSTSNFWTFYELEIKKTEINKNDSITFYYFAGTICPNCIYTYFTSELVTRNTKAEYKDVPDKGLNYKGNILLEQKTLGPSSYQLALTDLIEKTENDSVKAIFCLDKDEAKQLCRIKFIE